MGSTTILITFWAVVIVAAILIAKAQDNARNQRRQKQVADDLALQNQRLRSPQFAAVESTLQCKLSPAIVRLYENFDEIFRTDFEILVPTTNLPIYIAYYCPCDTENVINNYPDCLHFLTIASDGGDLSYMVDPKIADPPVVEYDVETGQFAVIAGALSEFVNWPRRSASYHGDFASEGNT